MRLSFFMLLVAAVAGCSTKTIPESSPSSTGDASIESSSNVAMDAVSNGTADVFVIDVRSKTEWDTGHVKQAVNIPHAEIVDRIAEVTDDKNAKIVLYCAVGGRAGKAKKQLEELGFTNVENAGGYEDVKDRFE